jgi:Ca-activated chloride channel family protein
MTTPAFNSNDDRLTAYALGELEGDLRAAFESELTDSPALQEELAELQSLTELLRSELAGEAEPQLTSTQHQALLAQVSSPAAVVIGPVITPRPTRHQSWVLLGPGIAAGLAITVGILSSTTPPAQTDVILTANSNMITNPTETIEEINRLYKEQRFAEVEDLTKKLRALNPNDPTAEALFWKARYSRRKASNDKLQLEKEGSFWKQLDDIEQSVIVSTGDPQPMTFGDNWKDITEKRRQQHTDDRKSGLEGKKPNNGPTDSHSISDGAQPPVALTQNESKLGEEARYKRNFALPQLATTDRPRYLVKTEELKLGSRVRFFHDPEHWNYRDDGQRLDLEAEAYEAPPENAFLTPSQQPLSTFSIDVDSASYSNVRRFLTQGQRPPADAVRVEEMVNYFSYNYPQPKDGEPFSVTADAAPCPWQPKNYLARIGLQARTIDKAKRPPTNLVFLLDVSGSMQAANKLPLVKQAMTMLCEELNERDRIAIVTYAGDAGVKLASTPGSDQTRIMQSIEALQAGGSTNGAAGINLAYEEALRHFNGEGENRVILCTDGDFNVGVSSDDQLVELIQQQAKTKVFLSIFGFGMGNLKDAKLEKLADKGNGHYGYIDDLKEARRVFNEELVGTLYTVAKDVKIQVEFNPLTVGAYRLIGYENRALAAKDFNDDTKDAGEIGAGHTVTALYEIAPKGQWPVTQEVDPLKYGTNAKEAAPVETAPKKNLSPESADDLFTVKLRYKQPTADVSVKTIDYVVDDIIGKKIVPSPDLVWAASVASFGMQLRNSQFKGNWTMNDVYEAAQGAKGADANGRRREFLDLVQAAKRLAPAAKQ